MAGTSLADLAWASGRSFGLYRAVPKPAGNAPQTPDCAAPPCVLRTHCDPEKTAQPLHSLHSLTNKSPRPVHRSPPTRTGSTPLSYPRFPKLVPKSAGCHPTSQYFMDSLRRHHKTVHEWDERCYAFSVLFPRMQINPHSEIWILVHSEEINSKSISSFPVV